MMRYAGQLKIRTPEGVEFSYAPAGPFVRMLAFVVDLAVIAVATNVIAMLTKAAGLVAEDFAVALSFILYFAITLGYGIALEWGWRGQTLGKRLLRLRVMDEQGLHLAFSQVVVRNLLRFFDSLPVTYLVGGIACLLSPKRQRLGDLAAGTVVVRLPQIEEPDLSQLERGKFNSLLRHPHLLARLRQRVGPREASVLLAALLRRDELAPRSRLGVYHELAGDLRKLAPFPEEEIEVLTDEQFLRNVVEVLFRGGGVGPLAERVHYQPGKQIE